METTKRLSHVETQKLKQAGDGLRLSRLFTQLSIWRYAVALTLMLLTMMFGCGFMTWTLLFR
jgi:hypothetical protein